jgi:uncharacterized surface protein with fasciclin (FAS1) repeats
MLKKTGVALALAAAASLATATSASAAPQPAEPTIVDIALAVNADSGEFSTLIAALSCTGLVPALDGKRQYTVFAPTDEAFGNLGLTADNVCSALGTDTLKSVLLYHVAPGERFAADVVSSDRIRTVSKGFLSPYVSSGAAYLRDGSSATSDAQIVATDIDATNGVIHVIDQVLLP